MSRFIPKSIYTSPIYQTIGITIYFLTGGRRGGVFLYKELVVIQGVGGYTGSWWLYRGLVIKQGVGGYMGVGGYTEGWWLYGELVVIQGVGD